jgi:hypothetical protein
MFHEINTISRRLGARVNCPAVKLSIGPVGCARGILLLDEALLERLAMPSLSNGGRLYVTPSAEESDTLMRHSAIKGEGIVCAIVNEMMSSLGDC